MYFVHDNTMFTFDEIKKEPNKDIKRNNCVKTCKKSNNYSTYENNIQYSYTGNTMVHSIYSSNSSTVKSMIK